MANIDAVFDFMFTGMRDESGVSVKSMEGYRLSFYSV